MLGSIGTTTLESRDFTGPYDYAKHLAKYVTCPSSIVAATANHFGRHRAVSLDTARKLTEQAAEARKKTRELFVRGQVGDEEYQRERAAMRTASQKMAKVVRLHTGRDWPCGHQRTPETTHWIAGVAQCKVCRRSRWKVGYAKAVKTREALASRRMHAIKWAEFQQEIKLARKSKTAELATARERNKRMRDIVSAFEGRLPLPELLFCIAGHFGITVNDLKGPARSRLCVHARAVAMRILKDRGLS